ncbi:nuclear transport factor 2 family protein [Williamsia muralis]|uniref:nuclear transport factor 2 family protein n=1 Tax=Williamsia marianensis TaxID=85044 RepID=UPI0016713382|nr:nuclear transport factor 2 family protein [Williamsia marianensis]
MQASIRAENVAIIERVYGLLQAFDVEAFAMHVHPDFTVDAPNSLPYGGLTRGTEEMKDRMSSFARYWDEPTFNVHAITADDEALVTAHVTLCAVGKATGERLEMEVVEVWSIEGGRISSQRTFYFDPVVARRAAGVTSEPST